MTWTYSGDPSASDLDEVRFLIGDVTEADPLLSDEEIEYLLGTWGTPRTAALNAVDGLIAKYSRLVSQSVGGVSISYGERIKNLQTLRAQIGSVARPAAVAAIGVYAGGISIADKESQEEDDDWDQPAFKRGMHDREST